MSFNELKQHGTEDFPFGIYIIDKSHPKYEMAFHWHASVEIIRVLKGELSITLDNKNFVAKSGDVVFVNSETIHGATPEKRGTARFTSHFPARVSPSPRAAHLLHGAGGTYISNGFTDAIVPHSAPLCKDVTENSLEKTPGACYNRLYFAGSVTSGI